MSVCTVNAWAYSTSIFPCTAIEAPQEVLATYTQLVTSIREDTPVLLEDLERVCSLSQMITTAEKPKIHKKQFDEMLRSYVQQLILSPALTLFDFETVWEAKTLVEDEDNHRRFPDCDFPAMLQRFKTTQDSQVYISLNLLNA